MTEVGVPSLQLNSPLEGVRTFVVRNAGYYKTQFSHLDKAVSYAWSFNGAAALLGPVWMVSRRLWDYAFVLVVVETLALSLLAMGISGPLGKEELAQASRLTQFATARSTEAAQARASAATNAAVLEESAKELASAANDAAARAQKVIAQRPRFIALGLTILLFARAVTGGLANWLMHQKYKQWLRHRTKEAFAEWKSILGSSSIIVSVYALAIYRFGAASSPGWLSTVPHTGAWRDECAGAVGIALDAITNFGQPFFGLINSAVKMLLDLMDLLLISAPWPLVMSATIFIVIRRLGLRAAVWTAAGIAYLALLGFWEESMQSIALLGTAAIFCVSIGLPLGIWCGRSVRVYGVVRPFLDLMQTMPTFVYLIPVIAFFGIGPIPAVVATVIVGVPPLVRMTAVGLQGVPGSVREAAFAYGASKAFVISKVDLPLAANAVKVGINQAVLTCLSMVVVASLIGASGLGEDVLHAISYASSGVGLLAGFAILICAMLMDRVAQGRSPRSHAHD